MTTTAVTAKRGWRVPTGLVMLGFIPVFAGAFRVAQLTGGAEITPDNERFFASPMPVVVHIVAVSVYAILGAFQFAPRFRARRRGWHRAAGRLLVACGLIGALTGLWLTLFFPRADDVGDLVTAMRIMVGCAWTLFLVLGFTAIRRRNVARHRAWMIRAYALAMGAGTQAVTQVPWVVAAGELDLNSKALAMFAGWAINVAVAEWIIRRRSSQPTHALETR